MGDTTLTRYREKRDFTRTAEPTGTEAPGPGPTRRYVIQKHDATRLHFDFRLELDGVLLSWAVPKGPSLDPADKRLAVHVEDHPLEYGDFEGVIPEGEYGGGPVMLWDTGSWIPVGDPREGYTQGKLKFRLCGHRLRGGWTLVRTRRKEGDKESWLLVKENDAAVATPGSTLVDTRLTSVRTRRTMEDILADRDPPIDAPPGPLPAFVPPALATPVDHAPESGAWRHELKLDGYRALLRVDAGAARVLTRSGLDWTERFTSVATGAATLPVRTALLDGEIVVLDARGRSDFGALVGALEQKRLERLVYFAFDLLHLDGHDLRGLPLTRRVALLAEVLADDHPPLRQLDHLDGGGVAFHRAVCALGLEGVVSKRPDAPYRSGRSRAWLKVRCGSRQELAIVGWTDPAGSRTALGALLVGLRDGETWRFAGRVGTGFDEAALTSLLARLRPAARPTPPVVDPPTGADARGCHWVDPRLVCEVRFTNWTPSGRLRHPVFLGLREDKRPEEVGLEVPVADADTTDPDASTPPVQRAPPPPHPTHPDRVFWPDVGVTKQDLAAWLDSVADRLLPEIARRPLTVVRCPNGHDAGCFYQRHLTEGLPAGTKGVVVPGHGEGAAYLWVEDRQGLVGLAQIGVLEIHPWGVRIEDLVRPDRLIFDLDPGPGVDWAHLVDVAVRTRDRLATLGLRSFAKLTGGKGVHVVVPLRPYAPWEVAKPFCRVFAERLATAFPDRITARMAKPDREGRVYLDWLRNTSTSTAVAAWSTRARPGAPVAVPVAWEALAAAGRGNRYGLRDLLGRLPPDPWGPLDAVDQRLDEAVLRRLGTG